MSAEEFSFSEQADYEKGFSPYFTQHIEPLLADLERDRIADLGQFYAGAVMGAIFVAASFLLLFFYYLISPDTQHHIDAIARSFSKHGDSVAEGKIDIMVFVIFIAIAYPAYIYKKYGNEAKALLLPPLLKFFGSLEYLPISQFRQGMIEPFGIMPAHNEYSSENNIRGALDNVPFELAEITLKMRQGKNTSTVFSGVASVLQMNKPFTGKTILRNHTGIFGKWQEHTAGLQNVLLEDPTFKKQFEVYSTDQVEARYILTPTFMERVIALSQLMGNWGRNPGDIAKSQPVCMYGGMRGSFYGDSLLLLIPCKADLFSPGTLFESAYRVDEIRCVLYQVHLIRQIIEILKLDQRSYIPADTANENDPAAFNDLKNARVIQGPFGPMLAGMDETPAPQPAPATAPVQTLAPQAPAEPAADKPVHHAPPADQW